MKVFSNKTNNMNILIHRKDKQSLFLKIITGSPLEFTVQLRANVIFFIK